jgi:hypothetical protein
MSSRAKNIIASLLIVAFLAGGVYLFERPLINELPFISTTNDLILIPEGNMASVMTLGFTRLFSDLAWIRSIQYFGAHFSDLVPEKAYGILDIVITLDPHIYEAYDYAGLVLIDEGYKEEWQQKGFDLIDRGIAANKAAYPPLERLWRLPFNAGFLYYHRLKDNVNALKYMEMSADKAEYPLCSDFVARFIAQIRSKQGDKITALAILYGEFSRYEETGDEVGMRITQKQINRVQDDILVEEIETAIEEYRLQNDDQCPPDLQALVDGNYINSIPEDPWTEGGEYHLDTDICRVFSDAQLREHAKKIVEHMRGRISTFQSNDNPLPEDYMELTDYDDQVNLSYLVGEYDYDPATGTFNSINFPDL